jgi:acyl-coenzyme A synthetase/AMP-(fatty) acid ligase
MKMPQSDRISLWSALRNAGNLTGRFLSGASATVDLGEGLTGSFLSGRAEEFRGRSVLIATSDQLTTALALLELDGMAGRLVLCPTDLAEEQVSQVVASVPVDAIVCDRARFVGDGPAGGLRVTCSLKTVPVDYDRSAQVATEWILLTSGTAGRPKMVAHTLSSLAGAIEFDGAPVSQFVWSTFYDIRRYGGLQIFLRAILASGSLVLSDGEESTADFLTRAGAHGVTHISGTPTHWRRALMSSAAYKIRPQYVRLSGEVVDQAILDNLRSTYPAATVVHAFASTEAGVAFDVRDGLAGFPANRISQASDDVQMKVEDDSLRIRSCRTAAGYLAPETRPLKDADGFIDTGDMLERRGDRYYFVGRRDGVINVGGLKVHPEEVEAVINRHPNVSMSLVRARRNPVTGALVVADVVLKSGPDRDRDLEQEILQLCRGVLPRHKVPAAIHFVSNLQVAATGKLVRSSYA